MSWITDLGYQPLTDWWYKTLPISEGEAYVNEQTLIEKKGGTADYTNFPKDDYIYPAFLFPKTAADVVALTPVGALLKAIKPDSYEESLDKKLLAGEIYYKDGAYQDEYYDPKMLGYPAFVAESVNSVKRAGDNVISATKSALAASGSYLKYFMYAVIAILSLLFLISVFRWLK